MELLRSKKLFYGISSRYTIANFESITYEEFHDCLIDKGVYFIWYFHYMPVGNDASPKLPTLEQRAETYRHIRHYRAYKTIVSYIILTL